MSLINFLPLELQNLLNYYLTCSIIEYEYVYFIAKGTVHTNDDHLLLYFPSIKIKINIAGKVESFLFIDFFELFIYLHQINNIKIYKNAELSHSILKTNLIGTFMNDVFLTIAETEIFGIHLKNTLFDIDKWKWRKNDLYLNRISGQILIERAIQNFINT